MRIVDFIDTDEYTELTDIDMEEEHLQHELDGGKELLLEADDIKLVNTNIIDNIDNVMIMANKVKKELKKTSRLTRENFVAINKMEWNCTDILTGILDKIKKEKED